MTKPKTSHTHGNGVVHSHEQGHTHSPEEYQKLFNRLSSIFAHPNSLKTMIQDYRDCNDL